MKTNEEYQAIKNTAWITGSVLAFLIAIIVYSVSNHTVLPPSLSAMLIFSALFALAFLTICLISLRTKQSHMDKLAKNPGWMDSQFLDDLNPHSVSGLNPASLMELTPLDVRSITSEKFIIHKMQEKAVNQALKGVELSDYLRKIPVIKKLVLPAPKKVKFKNVNPLAPAPGKKKPKIIK